MTLKKYYNMLKIMIPFLLNIWFAIFIIVSCNKKFDEPPVYTPPVIQSTLTIAQLKQDFVYGSFKQVTSDDVIEGVVIANDSSGNFYKQIIIQDETAGIAINIDDYNLFTAFPLNRKVYVRLKDLYLHDVNNLIQLSGSFDGNNSFIGIHHNNINKVLVKGNLNTPLIPKPVSVSELNDSYQNMLVQLQDFYFQPADTVKTYANVLTKASGNFTLKSCSAESITLRNSGYANFADVKVPSGRGTITAVYSVYNSTKQLYIRDTSDIQFKNERCTGGSLNTLASIADIRSLYFGTGIKLGAYKISGIVISDAANQNLSKSTIVLQNGNAGISVFIGGSTVKYKIGDSVVIDVAGDSLIKYNGQMEIKKAYGAQWPAAISSNKKVVPQVLTIQQLKDKLPEIEFTLVKIKNATATGGTTFSGNKTLSDATGNITLYTSSSAAFSGSNLPPGQKSWTGYATFFNSTKEFMMRNLNDIE